MFRPDRKRTGEDPLLLTKTIIFFVAAAIAFTGMALQRPLVIYAAIVLLGIGFLLRFFRPREDDVAPDSTSADEQRPPQQPGGSSQAP